jgi:hypothetical protein
MVLLVVLAEEEEERFPHVAVEQETHHLFLRRKVIMVERVALLPHFRLAVGVAQAL